MSLQQLTPEWRTWLLDNVARGCTAESLLPLMVQGGFATALSARAIEEAQSRPVQAGLSEGTESGAASSALALHQQSLSAAALQGSAPLRGRPSPQLDSNRITLSDGTRVRIAAVLDHPQVVLFDQFLSEAECQAMMSLADTRMSRSTVVDEQLGDARPHEHRTSAGGWFQLGENELVQRIEARLAELLRWPVENGEGLQVLRYEVGGEYRAHFDYFNPEHPGSQRHLAVGGQRVGTCVMYLDDVSAGGGTRFPSLSFEVRPMRGAMLYFADVDARGIEDPATLHAGSPVQQGVKYIATKWLRERRYG